MRDLENKWNRQIDTREDDDVPGSIVFAKSPWSRDNNFCCERNEKKKKREHTCDVKTLESSGWGRLVSLPFQPYKYIQWGRGEKKKTIWPWPSFCEPDETELVLALTMLDVGQSRRFTMSILTVASKDLRLYSTTFKILGQRIQICAMLSRPCHAPHIAPPKKKYGRPSNLSHFLIGIIPSLYKVFATLNLWTPSCPWPTSWIKLKPVIDRSRKDAIHMQNSGSRNIFHIRNGGLDLNQVHSCCFTQVVQVQKSITTRN